MPLVTLTLLQEAFLGSATTSTEVKRRVNAACSKHKRINGLKDCKTAGSWIRFCDLATQRNEHIDVVSRRSDCHSATAVNVSQRCNERQRQRQRRARTHVHGSCTCTLYTSRG